jgi:flagellar hook assembly protein FlgD
VGSFSGLALKDSYSNFPNPFAAGREPTRFVFYLRSPGRVSLRLWTAHGEVVRTVLDGRAFGSGLQQDIQWDGRNGNGSPVVNGAYLAELQVHYDDGTSERVLRKVAVVR